MTGHKPFSELTKDFSLERKAELSERLGIKQAAVSRMENRKDIHLSHLKKVIEAMGGSLVIIARFPNMEVCITM